AVIAGSVDPSGPVPPLEQLRASADAYRAFALHDPGTYALMFDRPVLDFEASPAALESAGHAFSRLVDSVSAVQAAGGIVDGDPVDLAQRFWATMHGAVSLERHGICFAADPDAHYAGLVDTLLRGLDPQGGVPGGGASPTRRRARRGAPAPRG
ncbi:MAG: WHG domain-containing protein, partial [Actinobacteria bacterium]|nr:WHG domain-containing protein [Actinomycetota bacterium]